MCIRDRCLFLTYVAEAGLSPTSTVARHGEIPFDFKSFTISATFTLMLFATSIPSILTPVNDG